MKYRRSFILLAALITATSGLGAQTPRRSGTRPVASRPAPTPTPTSTSMPAPTQPPLSTTAQPLAIVNGQTLTVLDLDPNVSGQVQQLDRAIAEARREVLNLQINTVLLDLEAG